MVYAVERAGGLLIAKVIFKRWIANCRAPRAAMYRPMPIPKVWSCAKLFTKSKSAWNYPQRETLNNVRLTNGQTWSGHENFWARFELSVIGLGSLFLAQAMCVEKRCWQSSWMKVVEKYRLCRRDMYIRWDLFEKKNVKQVVNNLLCEHNNASKNVSNV